ncbi:MAG: hypothetical protein RHS_5529 [Robinsoniella sp. RHS]|nr:MAG: hypothetical protein RHS_5529 [Robinsoniella sp. RHS]
MELRGITKKFINPGCADEFWYVCTPERDMQITGIYFHAYTVKWGLTKNL